MNIGDMPGSRVQAQVTAAGLLMMALCKPDWQEGWLAIHELKAYTSFTNASKDRVSIELARIRTQGWAISAQPLWTEPPENCRATAPPAWGSGWLVERDHPHGR